MRKEKEAKIERIRLEQLAISEEQKRVTQEKAEQKRLRRLVQSNLERIDAAKNYMFPRFISAAAFPKGYNLAQWEKIRVVTLGSTGCGKSSTIATLEKVIRQDLNGATCEIQSAGEEGTVILQEYLSEYNWSILDTRGFWHYGKEDVDEMLALLDGKISAGDYIDRDNNPNYNESAAAAAIDCVVAVAFVIKANDPLLHNQNMMNSLAFMRNHLRKQGLSPITIVTHCDLVGFDLRSTLEFASAATGSPRNLVFPIANYLPEDTEPKPDIEKQALDILEAALRTGEQYIRVRSQRDSRPKPAFVNAVPPPVNPVSVNANPQVSAQATKRVFITYESNKAKMFQITANDSLDSFLHKIEVAFDFTSASLFLENVEIDNESFTMIEHNDRLIVSPC